MTVTFQFGLRYFRSELLVYLLTVWIASSLFVCAFTMSADGTSFTGAIYVENEAELNNAISDAGDGVPVVIALNKNIFLTVVLAIPAHKNVTLTSNNSVFFKLFGEDNQSTIVVETGGILHLDGVIVTHATDGSGLGVFVNPRNCL